ncbi:hypothetical protein M9434_001039 [Picochlorum sp. BPE23]|nr:hypothetical protein M9434_001039 [Picochlorum sp. BPE23]
MMIVASEVDEMSRLGQQQQEYVTQHGFHVVRSEGKKSVGGQNAVDGMADAQKMESSMLSSCMNSDIQVSCAASIKAHPSQASVAAASMSPGLAMSQGDMTLADYSHLTPGVKRMMRSVVRGLKAYQEPEAATEGLGGTYFFKSENGVKFAIMKPCDEEPLAPNNPKGFVGRELGEPGLKPTVRVGEAASREVAAYLLDHGRFAKVPHTVMVRMSHPIFHYSDVDMEEDTLPLKLGSLQRFVHHDCDTTEMGTSLFDKKDVHRIGILDIRLFNTDRHGGNILVRKVKSQQSAKDSIAIPSGDSYELIPIDHGFALPEGLEPPYFEWQHWPQAMLPFDQEELDYIASLDAKADADLLRKELPDISEASFRVMELSTLLLQECAVAGLSLSEIADIMTRPIIGIDEEPSELEIMCFEVRKEMYEELKAAREQAALSHFSSMSISETADEAATPDSGSSATHFQMALDETTDIEDSTMQIKAHCDGLFSMDEDGGAKTPSPNSPLCKRKERAYAAAPSLRVRPCGEVETPFGTNGSLTFKAAMSDMNSVNYESDSPTHALPDEATGEVDAQNFRGAQSYVPGLATVASKIRTTGFPRAMSRTQIHGSTQNMADQEEGKSQYPPLVEPRGCSESSFVLKEMDAKEWEIFLAKIASKIAAAISSGAWQDKTIIGPRGQVQQMSCPRF